MKNTHCIQLHTVLYILYSTDMQYYIFVVIIYYECTVVHLGVDSTQYIGIFIEAATIARDSVVTTNE